MEIYNFTITPSNNTFFDFIYYIPSKEDPFSISRHRWSSEDGTPRLLEIDRMMGERHYLDPETGARIVTLLDPPRPQLPEPTKALDYQIRISENKEDTLLAELVLISNGGTGELRAVKRIFPPDIESGYICKLLHDLVFT